MIWYTADMRKEVLVVGGVIAGSLVLIVGLAFLGARPAKPVADVTTACVQHRGVGMHIHPHVTIILDDAERKIPADIGIVGPRCMRPLHTHDDSGTLHLEFPVQQEARLGQFFEVWRQPFSKQQILDRTLTEADTLRVTVNGKETQELETLLLHDRDAVVVEVARNK